MKQKLFFLVVAFASHNMFAQSKSLGDVMLDLIVKDGQPFEYSVHNEKRRTSEDSVGVTTLSVEKRRLAQNNYYKNLIVVDTFGIFSVNYKNNSYKNNIRVVRKLPTDVRSNDLKVFWLNGVGTGKENALALSIINLRTNKQSVYYFSILGKEVNIVKVSHGVL